MLGVVRGVGLLFLERCALVVPTVAALRGRGLAALVPGVAACELAMDRVAEEVRAGLGLDPSRFSVLAREVLEFREVLPLDWWGSSTVPDVGFVLTWAPVVLWMYEPRTCLHECRGL